MRIVPAFDLDNVSVEAVDDAIQLLPYFDLGNSRGIKKLLTLAILSVHGVSSRLFQDDVRDQLVFYYGRSSDQASNVISRWRSRGHRYAILLGRVRTQDVRGLVRRLVETRGSSGGLVI